LPEETQDLKQGLEFVLNVVRRRRWWIGGTFCAVTLGTILASYVIPAQYKSDATILVEQQKVPERYVTPTSTAGLLQALQAMTQQILSRNQLLQIVTEFDLYPRDRNRMGPDELVQKMRKDIEIEPLVPNNPDRRDSDAFRISFIGSKPETTRDVVSRLTSLFIVENLKSREEQAKGTASFLQDQLTAAQADLREQEQRLRDFKMQHLGELPQEQQGNLQVLSGLQMQLQNVQGIISRAREQQVYLESLIAQYRALTPKGDPTQPGPNRIAQVEKQLTDLRTQRAALIAHYTPEHPDVVNMNRQIAQTEALLELLKKNQKSSNGQEGTDVALTGDEDAATAQVKSQLKANRLEISNALEDEKRLQARIAEYQRRLNLTPVREQELSDLLRNYELSQRNYADLESKKTQSELASRLEQSQQGKQFRIVDPPNLPSRPFTPDRRKLGVTGAGLGLALGVALALFLEIKDTSLRSEKDAAQLLNVPFVFGIPKLFSPMEERRRTSARTLEWIGGSFLVTMVLAAELFVWWRG